MTPDALRSRLKMAIEEKDQGKLEAVIIDCEEAAYPELGSELRKARDTLTSLGGGRGGLECDDTYFKKSNTFLIQNI